MHRLLHEVPHQIFHVDSQIFSTIRCLLSWPGTMVNDFLFGKRKKYFPPLTFLFLTIGFYFFINSYLFLDGTKMNLIANSHSGKEYGKIIFEWLKNNKKLLIFMSIPIVSVSSYVMFKKSKYNFAEHIVLNTFFISGYYLIFCIAKFSSYLAYRVKEAALVDIFTILVFFAYPILFYFSTFRHLYKTGQALLRAFVTFVLTFVFIIIIMALVVVALTYIFDMNNTYFTTH